MAWAGQQDTAEGELSSPPPPPPVQSDSNLSVYTGHALPLPHTLALLTLTTSHPPPGPCLDSPGSVYDGDQIQPGVYPTSTSCEDRRERERERERAVRFESVRQWKGRDGDRRGGHRTQRLSHPPASPLHPSTLPH